MNPLNPSVGQPFQKDDHNTTSASHPQYRPRCDDECTICKKKFASRDVKQFLCCTHVFHAQCLGKYMEFRKFLCPICRKIISFHSTKHDHDASTTCRRITLSHLKEYDGTGTPQEKLYFMIDCFERYLKDTPGMLAEICAQGLVKFLNEASKEQLSLLIQNLSIESMRRLFDDLLDSTKHQLIESMNRHENHIGHA